MKEKTSEQLSELPYFGKGNLRLFQDNSDLSFDKNIQNWLKKGLIKKLKNGLYVCEKYLLAEPDKTGYVEFIASKLVYPSYLSGEYVLQKYSILTEAIYAIISISRKTTREINNFLGVFIYRNIKKELFIGFEKKQYKGNVYFQATKAKSLFDYIYLKKDGFGDFSNQEMEELRLNTDEITSGDLNELKNYIKLSRDRKMDNFFNQFKKYAGTRTKRSR